MEQDNWGLKQSSDLRDELNAKEREAVKNLSNRLAEETTRRYLGAVKNP